MSRFTRCLAVEEPHERLVLARHFLASALAEVAGGGDEPLLAEIHTAIQRPHDRPTNIAWWRLAWTPRPWRLNAR